MEKLSDLFYSIQQDNPHLSSYGCLLKTIDGRGIGKKMCEFYFDSLVEKGDYSKSDRDALIEDMIRISKPLI